MNKMMRTLKYNEVTGKVVVMDIYGDEFEVDIDSIDWLIVQRDEYLTYIVMLVWKFGYIFRQMIMKFMERDFKGEKTRKRTSIHTYLDILENKRFIKKIDFGKNVYYMLTKRGEIFANNSPVLYEKRLPNNQKLREAAIWAQYYLCNNNPLEFVYDSTSVIEDIYIKLMDIIDSPIYVRNTYNLVDEIINIINAYRREAKLPLAEVNLINNQYIVVNASYNYDIGHQTYQYANIPVAEIDFNKFLNLVQNEKVTLDRVIGKCDTNSYESSIKNHNYWNTTVGYSRCIQLLTLDTTKTDFLFERLFGRNFVQYNLELLNMHYDSPDEERKVLKRDIMFHLFGSSVYVQDLVKNQLKIIIIDVDRDKNWYHEKLVDIDIMLRRINYLSNNIIIASISIITDQAAKEKNLKKLIREMLHKFKKGITKEHFKLDNMNNFFWDRQSIYFINLEVDIILSEAKKYFTAATKDKEIKTSYKKIKL